MALNSCLSRWAHRWLCSHHRLVAAATVVRPSRSSIHSSTSLGCQWELMSAACVERFPVITQAMTPQEQEYSKLMEQLELENSLLSDHELRHREEEAQLKRRREEGAEEEEGDGPTQTALDLEDAWEAEAKLFTPADRITEADKKKDLKSVERRLDSKLVLLVKQKLGDQTHWVLPQGPRLQGESMREAAERVLQETCGGDLETITMGNAPCAFYQFRYPPGAKDHTGAKIFFFKMDYRGGQVELAQGDSVSDHVWVARDELPRYLSRRYLQCLEKFINDL